MFLLTINIRICLATMQMLSLDANMRVMAILDAAIRSSREGGEAQIIG